MRRGPNIGARRARELLSYDKATGVLRWRVDRVDTNGRGRICAGDRAGSICKVHGYRRVHIGGRFYRSGRLAFLIVMGRWPDPEVDHENLNRTDDRWCNLREATKSQNNTNKPARADSVEGLKGVARRADGKFNARIYAHLGVFKTAYAAHLAWKRAAKLMHGEFFNGKRRTAEQRLGR